MLKSINEVEEFIIDWNNRFPIDRWWRKKHSVSFNSTRHREISFLDMYIEFKEEELFKEFNRKHQYIPNKGNWIDLSLYDDSLLSKEERLERYKEEAKNIDLSQYNDDNIIK